MKARPLRIAFVSDAIYPYNVGGKEKRLFEISTRLAKRGHTVNIYCMKWWKEDVQEKIERGVHLHAISRKYQLYSGKRRSIRQAIFFSIACFKLLKEQFDVIDVDHMPHMILFPIKLVCVLKNKKLIATWNEVWGVSYWREYLGDLGYVAFILEWLSARLPDRIIAVSQTTKFKLENVLHTSRQMHVIPNGIDMQAIRALKPSLKKSDVIFAGRLLYNKHVDVLVEAISIVKKHIGSVKAILIGEGPEKNSVLQKIHALRLVKNVLLLDFLQNHNDLYTLMKSSKVFVLPSTREGFGIVVLEANACGIPFITIAHKDNASTHLIQDGKNGLLAALDSRDIAQKIMQVLKHPFKKKEIYASILGYDWDKITVKVENVYKSI